MNGLRLTDLTVPRGARLVLDGISLAVAPGEFVGLLGRNGAGKTTLLRAALGLIPFRGHSSLAALSSDARARQVAWLPQAREIAWALPVADVVALGRLAHRDRDPVAVEAALTRMGLQALRDRTATALSGGEQARVLIARALAQDTPLLLADEPVAGLDPAQQINTMQTFRALAAEGRSVVASLHDLGLAARHCTRLVALAGGRVVADGPPAEVLRPGIMAEVFGVEGAYLDTPDGPLFQPLRSLPDAAP
ncbi:ABC transporter ATP-binding protein [Gemmobacter serpentinus]|uniref:ABC transporter ATP-binding protein n=1 Tax=Gemmobacter serpentinus TaxID=2652247 RepID=UPI00124E537E|nr:ABC transporter ATP-binding protein [Gemmobacter serpentinus]